MPVWLGERTGMIDGKDNAEYDKKDNYWITKDALNPWYVVYGSTLAGKPINSLETKANKPNTSITHTKYSFEIKPNSVFSFPFIVAGSAKVKKRLLNRIIKLVKTLLH